MLLKQECKKIQFSTFYNNFIRGYIATYWYKDNYAKYEYIVNAQFLKSIDFLLYKGQVLQSVKDKNYTLQLFNFCGTFKLHAY